MSEVFDTPILLIIFNRPNTTKQVFDVIRKVKPRQLFIAADGPRINKEGEAKRCEETRQIISNIDWDCEIKTFFRSENVGCGLGPSEAITWMFQHVERGIILEDDCLPSLSFFYFCEELLEKYKDDVRIQTISGSNLLQEWNKTDDSYFFSLMAGIWGWATWKRAWEKFDFYVDEWKNQNNIRLFNSSIENSAQREIYNIALNKTVSKDEIISWWDYQWMFARVMTSSFGIVPCKNLIKNLGIGSDATHTIEHHALVKELKISDIQFPLKHPEMIVVDKEYDITHSSTFYYSNSSNKLNTRIKNILQRLLRNN